MLNPALMSSAKPDWETPDKILNLVRKVGPIALDPCTTEANPTGAAMICVFDSDGGGLACEWNVGGLVYVNPPYGRKIRAWMEKCIEEYHRGADIIALVPARPDAKWFQNTIPTAKAVCFLRGRLKFKGAASSAPFPSVLVYWGTWAQACRFREVFEPHGWVLGGEK